MDAGPGKCFWASGCSARWMIIAPWAAAGVLVVAGAWPTYLWGGGDALIAMTVAVAVVAAIAGLTGALAVSRLADAEPTGRMAVGLRMGVQRFLLTLAAAAATAWTAAVDTRPFLVWVAIAYMVVSKFETVAVVGWLRVLEKRAC